MNNTKYQKLVELMDQKMNAARIGSTTREIEIIEAAQKDMADLEKKLRDEFKVRLDAIDERTYTTKKYLMGRIRTVEAWLE